MGGNEIINLRNPDKPQSAVPRIFFYRKIQSLIDDYNLSDIKDIKSMFDTEKETNRRIIYILKGRKI